MTCISQFYCTGGCAVWWGILHKCVARYCSSRRQRKILHKTAIPAILCSHLYIDYSETWGDYRCILKASKQLRELLEWNKKGLDNGLCLLVSLYYEIRIFDEVLKTLLSSKDPSTLCIPKSNRYNKPINALAGVKNGPARLGIDYP